MPPEPDTAVHDLERGAERARALCDALAERFLGNRTLVELCVAALLADGHVLLQGTPGLGKTRLVRSLAQLLDLRFGRVQCTPDLMPGDVTGGEVLAGGDTARFRFVEGPVFCQVFLADEINRATPRTQSALLEAMEERQVTAGGVSHPLPCPFFLAATQNPIELEGTYPLPEAQLDRFLFLLEVPAPGPEVIEAILALPAREEAPPAPLLGAVQVLELQELAACLPLPAGAASRLAALVHATQPAAATAPPAVREHVEWGASPRGARAVLAGARGLALLRGRAHVAPADLRDALCPALRHRVLLRYEATAAGVRADTIVAEALRAFPIH